MNITKKEIEALAIVDADYVIASYDAITSKEALKEAVHNLERLYNAELKAYNAHQSMEPTSYSGVYVFTNAQACVYRNTRAEAYQKAIRCIKDMLQKMD